LKSFYQKNDFKTLILMCGILFYIGKSISKPELLDAFNTIAHRGPDETIEPRCVGSITYIDGSSDDVIQGFHRLSINGLDSASGQPMTLNNTILICNGEIYNHKKLAEQHGFVLNTHSDCEIILHMYNKFGITTTLQAIEGVFSLVIFDQLENKLFVARDPIGIRPSFYGFDNYNGMIVASEAKALFKLKKCNHDSIKHVPIGSYIEVNKYGTQKPVKYITLTPSQPTGAIIEPDQELLKLIEHAVEVRASMADRPVGVFLSGGLDSSAIAALAKKHIPHLRSFSIALKDSISSDLINARKVAEHLNLEHTEVFFTLDEAFSSIKELIYQLGTCDITTIRASLPMYLLSKYIKNNTDIVVMLSGEGPDEVMSGYLYNHNAPSVTDLHNEAIWRTNEMHKFDVLRADHSTAKWSLEVRVPYLCKHIVKYVFGLDPKLLDPKHNNGIEKYLLRQAISSTKLLPEDIVWRPKEAFSDGVGYNWVNGMRDYAEKCISSEKWDARHTNYPLLTPHTKEALLYREIYEEFYARQCEPMPDYYWLPKWSENKTGDPSARVLQIHSDRIKN